VSVRFIVESECGGCGRFHHDALLRPGGHPESSAAYCDVGSKRIHLNYQTVLDIVTDVIEDDTFAGAASDIVDGLFDWGSE